MTDGSQDTFTWTVRVGSTSGGTAAVFVRKHQFAVGAPIQFDAEYPHVTALEYMLGAVGAELVNGVRLVARRRRVSIENVEVVVRGTLNNALVYLAVVGETGHPGIDTLEMKVYVSSLDEPDIVQQVWQETIERSPLVRTLSPLVRLTLELKPVI